jgi:hypothetical protein
MKRARITHSLESAERRTSKGHGKKVSEREALTIWRAQSEGQVRTRKESERARGTHFLESAERGTSEDAERKRGSKGHSLSGERGATDM